MEDLLALRFLLSAAESIQLAAFFIVTNMWYTREEQPIRLMAWYGMSPIAIIVGSLFAYGIGHIDSSIGLWRFPFIICGAISVVWAVILWFALPSNPASAWFLNERERIIALRRMEDAKTGVESKKFKMDQAIEALLDPKVWLAGLSTGAGNILNGIGLVRCPALCVSPCDGDRLTWTHWLVPKSRYKRFRLHTPANCPPAGTYWSHRDHRSHCTLHARVAHPKFEASTC